MRARLTSAVIAAAAATLCACTYERKPEGTVRTTARYDSASRELRVECTETTTGKCHLLVESGGKRREATLAVGSAQAFADVDPAARTCVAATAGEPPACNWVDVHQPAGG